MFSTSTRGCTALQLNKKPLLMTKALQKRKGKRLQPNKLKRQQIIYRM